MIPVLPGPHKARVIHLKRERQMFQCSSRRRVGVKPGPLSSSCHRDRRSIDSVIKLPEKFKSTVLAAPIDPALVRPRIAWINEPKDPGSVGRLHLAHLQGQMELQGGWDLPGETSQAGPGQLPGSEPTASHRITAEPHYIFLTCKQGSFEELLLLTSPREQGTC